MALTTTLFCYMACDTVPECRRDFPGNQIFDRPLNLGREQYIHRHSRQIRIVDIAKTGYDIDSEESPTPVARERKYKK